MRRGCWGAFSVRVGGGGGLRSQKRQDACEYTGKNWAHLACATKISTVFPSDYVLISRGGGRSLVTSPVFFFEQKDKIKTVLTKKSSAQKEGKCSENKITGYGYANL